MNHAADEGAPREGAPGEGALSGPAARLAALWRRHGRWLTVVAVLVMAAFTVLKMQDEIPRLIWGSDEGAATDIRKFHRLVHGWFRGEAIYDTRKVAVYPPATYLLLWPLVGWFNLQGARLAWFVGTVFVTVGLARVLLAECRPRGRWQRAFVVLLLVSMNATGVTLGIGQLGLHLMLASLGGLLLLTRGPVSWSRDLAGSALILWSLVKPPVTAPLFWLVVFAPGRKRPAVLTVTGYLLATLLSLIPQFGPGPYERRAMQERAEQAAAEAASAMQARSTQSLAPAPSGLPSSVPGAGDDPDAALDGAAARGDADAADLEVAPVEDGVEVLEDAFGMAVKGAERGSVLGGYGNVQSWLGRLGWEELSTVVSVLILGVLGVWVWRHRRVDLWLLLGVAALVARLWMYHRLYDDVLTLLPMIALYRLATRASQRDVGWWAGALLAAAIPVLLTPARYQQHGRIWPLVFEASHVLLWLAMIALLAREARRARRLLEPQRAPSPAGAGRLSR